MGVTGAMKVTGVTTLTNGATLDTRTLTLNGDGLFDNYLNMNNFANLIIPAGKTLTCTTSGNTPWGGTDGTLTLAGTLIKNGPGYLAFDVLVFQNTGNINLNQGDIYLGFWGKNGTH